MSVQSLDEERRVESRESHVAGGTYHAFSTSHAGSSHVKVQARSRIRALVRAPRRRGVLLVPCVSVCIDLM